MPAFSQAKRTPDADSEITSSIDGNGNTTKYFYDKDGHQTAVKDGLGNTTTYVYDADGNL